MVQHLPFRIWHYHWFDDVFPSYKSPFPGNWTASHVWWHLRVMAMKFVINQVIVIHPLLTIHGHYRRLQITYWSVSIIANSICIIVTPYLIRLYNDVMTRMSNITQTKYTVSILCHFIPIEKTRKHTHTIFLNHWLTTSSPLFTIKL